MAIHAAVTVVGSLLIVLGVVGAGVFFVVQENLNLEPVKPGEWVPWSVCSVSCGSGKHTRKRTCKGTQKECSAFKLSETEECNTEIECPIHGEWASWGTWAECPVTCGGGSQAKTRCCIEPTMGGEWCRGDSNRTRPCNSFNCPINGSWSQWDNWQSCDVTCDSGHRMRTRSCDSPAPAHGGSRCDGGTQEYEECTNLQNCPVNGNWTNWGSWQICSTACGPGLQKRERSCTLPAPMHNGNPCEGDEEESVACQIMPCPVHGKWSQWQGWSSCSEVCEGGFKKRERFCDSPSPANGGSKCLEHNEETVECNAQDCPIFGNWGAWAQWGNCPVTCGGGSETRSRTCTDPSPQNGGNPCQGQAMGSRDCSTQLCPVDGKWSGWSDWSQCTLTCAGGTQYSERTCSDPAPAHGGDDCEAAPAKLMQDCNIQKCPINGGWTEWTAWGACTKTCHDGQQIATRTCTNPEKQYGGLDCAGSSSRSQQCGLPCPVDGKWGNWGPWGTCSKSCETGVQEAYRDCDSPLPINGGLACTGVSKKSQSCNPHPCPVDGVWSGWGNWDACSKSCNDGGTQMAKRTCTNPAPDHGGLDCKDQDTKTQACNTHINCPIHGNWGEWSATSCTKSCAGGTQTKTRQCNNPAPKHNGANCPGISSVTNDCNTHPCPIDGKWTDWPWSDCTKSCETGTRTRTRTCTNPAPQFYGLPCVGVTSETEDCNPHPCPIHGKWGGWTAWSSCSRTCYYGTKSRSRQCDKPKPEHGGDPCSGPSSETEVCDTQKMCGHCAEEFTEDHSIGYCYIQNYLIAAGETDTLACNKMAGEYASGNCIFRLCSSGWSYNRYGDACYRYRAESKNWYDAENFCKGYGAHLTSVNNAQEQSFLTQFAGKNIWFGLNDQASEGTWRNIDGTPHSYSNWKKGEPNNKGNEDCAELQKDTRWNDEGCGDKKHFICEKGTFRYVYCNNPNYWLYMGNQRCYRVVQTTQDFDAARAICKADGGELASLTDDKYFAAGIIQGSGVDRTTYPEFWIGMKGSSWLDGTSMSGALLSGSGSDCGVAAFESYSIFGQTAYRLVGKAKSCSESLMALCEYPADQTNNQGLTIT